MAQLLWKTKWQFLKILKIELLLDSAILFLDKYPKETKTGSQIDTYILMFKAALFIIAQRWRQPRCLKG
jgi:hypothetical protein